MDEILTFLSGIVTGGIGIWVLLRTLHAEQVSKRRVDWIIDIRADIAAIAAYNESEYYRDNSMHNILSNKVKHRHTIDDLDEVLQAKHRILSRLNATNDPNHEAINELNELLYNFPLENPKKTWSMQILLVSKIILDYEWNRVKKEIGE